MYIHVYNNWYMLCFLVDSLLTGLGLNIDTKCHNVNGKAYRGEALPFTAIRKNT